MYSYHKYAIVTSRIGDWSLLSVACTQKSLWATSTTWPGIYDEYSIVLLSGVLKMDWQYSCGTFSGSQIPQRWIFAGMGCMAIINAYAMRICLSIAITEMVKPSSTTSNGTVSDTTCPSSEAISVTPRSGGTYEWDEYTQVRHTTWTTRWITKYYD